MRSTSDPTIDRLTTLFGTHPAWRQAAGHLARHAESAVYFRHLPGRAWRLTRRGGETHLLEERADDPDFAFCFTPAAVDRLATVRGDDVGDFAVALFSCIVDPDESHGIGFRIVAPFSRLIRRGYLRLVLAAGPKLLAFGAARGIRTLGELQHLVRQVRQSEPAPWETDGDAQGPAASSRER